MSSHTGSSSNSSSNSPQNPAGFRSFSFRLLLGLTLAALVTGVFSGLGAIALHYVLDFMQELAFGHSEGHHPMVTDGADPARRGQFRFADGSEHVTVDVIFPVLHGLYGEDGTIQGLFELSGVPYVGTGVLSSACGMDKEYTKKLLAAEGLPVGKEVILRGEETLTQADCQLLGLPVYVKPARGGSSLGISRVTRWEDMDAALREARQYDTKVIVESEIIGDEVECGVLEYPDGTVVASVPAQLVNTSVGHEGFYGFDAKYVDGDVSAMIPAPLDDAATRLIQSLAREAFQALQCSGLARVDFFVTPAGPVLNEVNTMPGFTPISMYPQVFAASGVPYAELLDTLIARALA